MPENEFEKQVQQKMNEFDLHPSEEVWMDVERRIRKEKKRRVIFWWPLLFLLVGGGITAWILIANKKEKAIVVNSNNNTKDPIQLPSENSTVPNPVHDSISSDKKDIPGNSIGNATIKEDNSVTKISSGKEVFTILPRNRSARKEKTVLKKQDLNKPVITNDKIVITEKQNKDQKDQPAVAILVPAKPPVNLPDSSQDTDIAAQEKKDIQQKKQPEALPQTTDSINKESKTKSKDKKPTKWDWGFAFSGGRSTTVNGLHFFGSPVYSYSAASLGGSGSPGVADPRTSSNNRPSGSFGAGLFIKRPVSKKLDLNIGLSYSYLSTKLPVGSRVDSTRIINNSYSQGALINNFYRPAGNSSYTNRYHFMVLSGDISWRIINGNKLKVYWDNGLSYNRLLGSSMLHYDYSLPGYYKDNKLLNKDQLFLSTGLSIPVSKRIIINPFATYSLTRVLKNSDSLYTHYTNFGIRFRFLFNKK